MILFLYVATLVTTMFVLEGASILIAEWNFVAGTAFAFSSGLILGIGIIPRLANWFSALEKRLEEKQKMALEQKRKQEQLDRCYQEGRDAYPGPENNPYLMGELMERCAWAGGYHDHRREVEG